MSMTHQTVTGREHLELRGPAGQERLTCRLCGSSVPTWPWPNGATCQRMFDFAREHDACVRRLWEANYKQAGGEQEGDHA